MTKPDYIETVQFMRECNRDLTERSEEYCRVRTEYGEARARLMVHLILKQRHEKYQKAAIDKQILFLASGTPKDNFDAMSDDVQRYFKLRERYKGLKMIIKAIETKITTKQTEMNYQRNND